MTLNYDKLTDETLAEVASQAEREQKARKLASERSRAIHELRQWLGNLNRLPHRKECVCGGKLIDSRCLKDAVHGAGYTIAEYV